MRELNEISSKIIGCAINVHKELGPGLLETIYEKALCYELNIQNVKVERQINVPVLKDGIKRMIL